MSMLNPFIREDSADTPTRTNRWFTEALGGNTDALDQLVRRHQPDFNLAVRMSSATDVAEDATQENPD